MSQHSLHAEDRITRDDIALLARTSPDTIRRDIKKHGLETDTDAAGRVLVRVADFLAIGRIRPEDLTAGATPGESAEVLRARETITALRMQVAELSGRLRHSDALVDTLRDQLGQKDKQLAKQADPVSQLIVRLGALAGAA